MAIFEPKPWVNPFGEMSIFRLFKLFFYSLERHFFVVEYRKSYFPGLYCPKRKFGQLAFFGPKPWINPFEKVSIFRLFEFFVFIA